MKRIRKRDILSGILAIIAVANLVLLFGFDYEIFGFEWEEFYNQKFSHESEVATTADSASQAATVANTVSAADNKNDGAGTADTSEEMIAADGASTAESAFVEDGTKKCRVISSKNARIRSGPGTEYERITSVPRDTILAVLGVEENGWVHIRTDDGVEGYISGDLVEMIDEE